MATTTCTPSYNTRLSSDTFVPPTEQWTFTFNFSPNNIITLNVYWLNSLVGDNTNIYNCNILWSNNYNELTQKAPVLPAPAYAYAIVSLFNNNGFTAFF